MKMWSRFVFVAVVMTLSVAPAYADNEDPGAYIGLRAGYNLPEVWLDSFAGLAEHTDVTAWHLAASGGYDFGFVRVGGTLWHYFLTIDDGIWRGDGEAALDQ
ncbi:MAG: hypothetical protein H6684_14655, partial [Deltaproteobacteria bacterium]|nr:hypothetical protein [Deltaproteobacteria bacterium]